MASKERKMISIKDKELHTRRISCESVEKIKKKWKEKVGLWGTLVTVRNH